MKTRLSVLIISLLATFSLQAQTNDRYIEVTGTSEIEIVPDKIHYLIEIREYFVRILPKQVLSRMPSVHRKSVTIGGSKGRTFWFPRNSTLP